MKPPRPGEEKVFEVLKGLEVVEDPTTGVLAGGEFPAWGPAQPEGAALSAVPPRRPATKERSAAILSTRNRTAAI